MAGQDSLSSRTIELDEALDKSLALLKRGRTPEDCLTRFPERAEELRPLLEVAAQIRRVAPPTPPSTDGATGKQRMLDALARKKSARPGLGARLNAWIDALFEGGAEQGIDVQRLLRSAVAAAAVVLLIAVGTLTVRSWQGMTVRQQAVLASQGGLVEVLPLGADAWLPVSEVMLVEAGDRIRTGTEGAAELTFFDGSVTELRPMAELSIARMTSLRTGGEKVIVLHQWLGESHNEVEPLVDEVSRFSLQTASAVLSVRGTAFTVIVEPDGTTHLTVGEGTVAVQTRETSMLVSDGEEFVAPSPLGSMTPSTAAPSEPSGPSASPTPTETAGSSSETESPEPLALTETPQTLALDATQTTEAITTPQPTSMPESAATATESPTPTATESSRPTATGPSPTENEPSPTETQPSPTETQPSPTETQPPPTETTEPSPTETQPPPTETQPSPTETQPPPTETQPSPTETQPSPTETQPSPTETQPPPTETQPPPTEPPPTATEPPPTEPPPTETKVKETPPGHTNTPEPPGQTKTPEPPGQTKTPESSDDGVDLSRRASSRSLEQDRRTFLHRASFLVEQLSTGPIWLGIVIVFLPLSLLLQEER